MVLSDDGFSGSFSQRIDMKIHVCVYVYAHCVCVYIYICREREAIHTDVCVCKEYSYILCKDNMHTDMCKKIIHTDVYRCKEYSYKCVQRVYSYRCVCMFVKRVFIQVCLYKKSINTGVCV